jgi:hydroxymethylglutaryl-CoA reductase (NADPH)
MLDLRLSKSVIERRNKLETELNISFPAIGQFNLDEDIAPYRNCENMVGTIKVPLGIAGPLTLKNDTDTEEYYLPLATTEGALVASISRGCKAIGLSGGFRVDSDYVGATRGPVFATGSILGGRKFTAKLDELSNEIKSVAASTSSHLTLTSWIPKIIGQYVYVRFVFDCQDAMGLNMVTIASEKIAEMLEKKAGVECISLSGNFCVDKKPSWQNNIYGRGYSVRAEVVIPEDILQKTLKTNSFAFYRTWLGKCMVGSAISGSLGFNAQYANIISAIFIATGQDPAHVVEGSQGITTAEVKLDKNDKPIGLYISINLPSLMLGTVGGGTGLKSQNEALSILGLNGGNHGENARKFAEVVSGAVLAGEISLLASLSEGSLARAHQKLGRGRK